MHRTAIIVTFDRLSCAGLGCYGNEWIDTPGFDTLAAQGFAFDNHISMQVRGESGGLSHGPRLAADWIGKLRDAGVQTTLLHEPQSELTIDHASFDTVHDCGGQDGLDVAATDLPFAKLVQRATAVIGGGSAADRLIWLSSAGVPDVCRPPEEALDLYVEEFAHREIDWESLTPEEFGRQPAIRAAYLSLVDHWLGELRAAVATVSGPVLLIVLGCEGQIWQPVPRRSPVPGGLESQCSNSPWLMWANDGSVMPGRSPALVQLSDLPPTVVEWWSSSSGPLAPVFGGEGWGEGAIASSRSPTRLSLTTGEVRAETMREGASGPLTLTLSPEDGGEGTGQNSGPQPLALSPQPSLWSVLRGERDAPHDAVVTVGINGAMSVRTLSASVVFARQPSAESIHNPSAVHGYVKPEDLWDANDVAASLPEVVARASQWLTARDEKSAGTVAVAGSSR